MSRGTLHKVQLLSYLLCLILSLCFCNARNNSTSIKNNTSYTLCKDLNKGTSVLSPVVPLLLMVVPAVVVAWKSPHSIYLTNPSLYLLTFGFVAARVTNRLVVAHMTKSEMAYTDASMLGPALLFLNQYFNCPVPEDWLLYFVWAYVTCDLIKYCRDVCLDICDHLGIYLFVIDTPSGHASDKHNGKYNTRSKAKGKI